MPFDIHYLFSIQICLLFFTSSLCLSTKAQDQCPPCEKSNITYLCRSLPTLGAKIRLCYYNTTPNATLDVVFSVVPPSPDGWVAWGLNPIHAQMIDSQVLIAHRNPVKGVNVSQAVLSYDTKHGCGVSQAGFEVNVSRASADYIAESRMMILYAELGLPHWCNLTRFNHVWQVGPGMNGDSPVRHMRMLQNFDSRETINLTSGHVLGYKRNSLRKAHGILGITGWGFLLPCGVIIARYFRECPFNCNLWFLVHVGVQICAYIIGTIGWAIGLSLGQPDHFHTFIAHRVIGITIFGLATLQMLAIFLKPTRNDRYRRYWNIYHHFLGYTLLTLVVINIFKGLAILQAPKSWKHAYIILLILLSSIAFLLEVVAWVRFHWINFEFTLKHKSNTHHSEAEGSAKQTPLEQERSNRAS
ncbi:cytochrome b561 and DOMON domain-containing protein At3g25290-like [Carex rostrata]